MEVREQRAELLQRIPRLRLAFTLLLVLIGTCYWFVQVVQGGYYRELADNNRLNKVPMIALNVDREIVPRRGAARGYDSSGRVGKHKVRFRSETDLRIPFAKQVLVTPVRGRRAAVEQTSLCEHHRAGTG